MKHDTDELKELRWLREALWYIRWALTFSLAALVTEIIGIVILLHTGSMATFLKLLGVAAALWLISIRLRRKSHECRCRADDSKNVSMRQ